MSETTTNSMFPHPKLALPRVTVRFVRLGGHQSSCDCCGRPLTAQAVETSIGVFGRDCWKDINLTRRALRAGMASIEAKRESNPAVLECAIRGLQ